MKKTILIIEDDPNVLKNLEILLKQENYNVFIATNGLEGVTVAKEIVPELIICDILMPKMDGYKVIETLSLDVSTQNIPFLFLTSKTELQDIRKGMGLGADDYLIKPYNIDDLLNSIETRINKHNRIRGVHVKKIENDNKSDMQLSESDSIFIDVNNKPQFIKTNSIVFINAERQYTNLKLNSGANILVRKSLTHWERILPENAFLRIHRSSIINLNYIRKVDKWFKNSYKIDLVEEFGHLIMSKRYASKLKKLL